MFNGIKKFFILRRPRRGRLEGGTAFVQRNFISFASAKAGNPRDLVPKRWLWTPAFAG